VTAATAAVVGIITVMTSNGEDACAICSPDGNGVSEGNDKHENGDADDDVCNDD